MTNAQAMTALATGAGAQYPMLSALDRHRAAEQPDAVDDIGFFALPADKAADTAATIWQPNALYIPKTTTGAKLDAAKKFVAFANSKAGCDVQNKTVAPAGPYVTSACKLPDRRRTPDRATCRSTSTSGKTAPALEFLSPIKGPNLENITVQVGSGITHRQAGCRPVRRRREEAGSAARPQGLVIGRSAPADHRHMMK